MIMKAFQFAERKVYLTEIWMLNRTHHNNAATAIKHLE